MWEVELKGGEVSFGWTESEGVWALGVGVGVWSGDGGAGSCSS